jgi:integrase
MIQVLNNIIKYFNLDVSEHIKETFDNYWSLLSSSDKVERDNKRTNDEHSVMLFSDFLKLLEKNNKTSGKLYAMAKLYDILPLRDDMTLTIIDNIKDEKENINYLLLKNNLPYECIINWSKGAKNEGSKHEKLKVKITDNVRDILSKYMQKNNISVGNVLFNTYSGSNSNFLSRALKTYNLVGGVSLFRKMKVAELDKYDMAERVKLARIMGHTMATQLTYQRIVKK